MSKKSKILLWVFNTFIIFSALVTVQMCKHDKLMKDVEKWARLNGVNLTYDYSELVRGLPDFLRQITKKVVRKNIIKIDIDDPNLKLESSIEEDSEIERSSPLIDLSVIANLKYLEDLSITCVRVKSFSAVGKINGLKRISIVGTDIENLNELKSHTKLKNIVITGSKIKDISVFKEFSNLEDLQFINTLVKDFNSLRNLPNLKNLCIVGASINDLSFFESLQQLRWFVFGGTKIKNISILKKMENLSFLALNPDEVSKEQVMELQKALPNCQIDYSSGKLVE